MFKYVQGYMTHDVKRLKSSGAHSTVKPKKVFLLTDVGQVQKKRVAVRVAVDNAENNHVVDEVAYQKIINPPATQHPGILPPFMIENNQYVLFASIGSLEKFPLNYQQARIGFAQIVNTIKYMHEKLRVVHLDIKESNIVMLDNGVLALIDFDGVRDIENFDASKTKMMQTPLYIPPELYFNNDEDWAKAMMTQEEKYRMCDIWSLGITIFRVLAPSVFENVSKNLFSSYGVIKTKELEEFFIKLHGYIDQIELEPVKEIVKMLLCQSPKERLSNFDKLANCQFFQGVDISLAYNYSLVPIAKPPAEKGQLKQYIHNIGKKISELKALPPNKQDKQTQYNLIVHRHHRNHALTQLAKLQAKSHGVYDRMLDQFFIPTPVKWAGLLKSTDRSLLQKLASHKKITTALVAYHNDVAAEKALALEQLSNTLSAANQKDLAVRKVIDRIKVVQAWHKLEKYLADNEDINRLIQQFPDKFDHHFQAFKDAKDNHQKYRAFLAMKNSVNAIGDAANSPEYLQVKQQLNDPDLTHLNGLTEIPSVAEWQKMSKSYWFGLFARARSSVTKKLDLSIALFHEAVDPKAKTDLAIKIIHHANRYLEASTSKSSRVDAVANLLQRAIYYVEAQLTIHPDWRAPAMDVMAEQLNLNS